MVENTTITTCKHIALIPDGNRRWAKAHTVPALVGHQKGYECVREFIGIARDSGISFVTVWAFSTENWKRDEGEVADLMTLIQKGLSKIHEDAKKEKTKVIHIGRRDRLSKELIALLEEVEEETKEYTDFCLCLAIDYGGQDEIERASMRMKEYDDKNVLSTEGIKTIVNFSDTAIHNIPSPDLIIRTGGEIRTSGFMVLQGTYAEWIFTDTLLPDFDTSHFKKAIDEYASRVRRFGK